jgi:hypothetical protein
VKTKNAPLEAPFGPGSRPDNTGAYAGTPHTLNSRDGMPPQGRLSPYGRKKSPLLRRA